MRKVLVKNTTGKANDTQIIDAETGELLTDSLPIDLVQINIIPGDSVHVRIGLASVPFDLAGAASLGLLDPRTGMRRAISAVMFADGDLLTFGDGDGPKAEGPLSALDQG